MESEYSKKDSIIENTVFEFVLEIKTKRNSELRLIENCRYAEAIDKMIKNNNIDFLDFRILKLRVNDLYFRLVI